MDGWMDEWMMKEWMNEWMMDGLLMNGGWIMDEWWINDMDCELKLMTY
jgi:hypothetical protein